MLSASAAATTVAAAGVRAVSKRCHLARTCISSTGTYAESADTGGKVTSRNIKGWNGPYGGTTTMTEFSTGASTSRSSNFSRGVHSPTSSSVAPITTCTLAAAPGSSIRFQSSLQWSLLHSKKTNFQHSQQQRQQQKHHQNQKRTVFQHTVREWYDPENPTELITEDIDDVLDKMERAERAEGIDQRRVKYLRYEKPTTKRKRLKGLREYKKNKSEAMELMRYIQYVDDVKRGVGKKGEYKSGSDGGIARDDGKRGGKTGRN